MYQPQVDSWKDYALLEWKSAIAVKPKGKKEAIFGAIHLQTQTETDNVKRMVRIKDITIESLTFPNIKNAEAANLKKIVAIVLPTDKTMLVSLDRILPYMEDENSTVREIEVNLDPPPIHYSDKPAILVIFLGEPKFESIKGTQVMFATNTNWDLLMDLPTSTYYLLNGESWLTTKDLKKGPWTAAQALPGEFGKLPNDDNWSDVRKNIPGVKAKQVPAIFVSEEPAELIVTEGSPSYSPINGTKILYATNTESDLFLYAAEGDQYFLVAGRWFRAKSLEGPWTAATTDLPADFAKIPSDHAKGYVLASVPTTPEAEAAVLLASVPKKATVNRQDTTVEVVYEGDPEFVVIKGTSSPMTFAVNSPNTVFKVKSQYYCCHQGVWFQSAKTTGPWAVCTSVPKVIYTIPSTHPTHNVTYVYVYESTHDGGGGADVMARDKD